MSERAGSGDERGLSARGWRARELEEELPGLSLFVGEALHTRKPRSRALAGGGAARLRELSNRFRGARAVGLRREPVPAAYRVFFRQIGLDPDVVRTPIEAAVMERMLRGGFATGGLLADVLLIALLDTGVPVWALDARGSTASSGIRACSEGEPLGRSPAAPALPAGASSSPTPPRRSRSCSARPAPGHEPGAETQRLTLFAVQVAGVPSLYVEEALWNCSATLERW